MNNFKINADFFCFDETKKIKVQLSTLPKDIKIVEAFLCIHIGEIVQNSGFDVHYSNYPNSNESWGVVDHIQVSSNDYIKINISDELQNAIHNKLSFIEISFVGENNLTFAKDSASDLLNIDYISLAEYQTNGSSHSINLGKSGNASVNLATGTLSLTTPIVYSDSNVLPISVNANYSHIKNTKIPADIGLPDGWHLNINQFLIKEQNDANNLQFCYIDENGKSQIIEEKYSYKDSQDKTKYALRKPNYDDSLDCEAILAVDLDGQYIAKERTKNQDGTFSFKEYPVKTELIAPSGLKLVSSIADVVGANLVDNEPEELLNIRQNIKQLESYVRQTKSSLESNKSQLALLSLSKQFLSKQTKLQKQSITENKSSMELQRQIEVIRAEYSRLHRDWGDAQKNEYGTTAFSSDLIGELYNLFKSDQAVQNFTDPADNSDDFKKFISTFLNEISSLISLGGNYSGQRSGSLFMQKLSNDFSNELYNTEISLNSFETDVNGELAKLNYSITSEEMNEIYYAFRNSYQVDGENYTKFTLSLKDFVTLDLQIASLVSTCKEYEENLKEYNNNLTKLNHKRKLYEAQMPVHYLYNDSNIIYGFGRTYDDQEQETNVYRLVLITDSYENNIRFGYESLKSNRVESIQDSAENIISFKYEKDMLKEVVDSKERKTALNISCDKIESNGQEVDVYKLNSIDKNGQTTLFTYQNQKIKGVLDSSGFGVVFSYDDSNSQVISAQEVSVLKNVEHENPSYAENYLTDKFSFAENTISDKKVMFSYDNYQSTTISDHNDRKITYLFDKCGKVTTIYQNDYSDEEDVFSSLVNEYSYENDKVVGKVSKLPSSINYLEGAKPNQAKVTKTSLHMGNIICGLASEQYAYSYDVYDNYNSSTNKSESVEMLSKNLEVLNSEILATQNVECKHHIYLLSCWAKADSAFICPNDDEDSEYADYIKNRKFEIRAKIDYANGSETFKKSFDWRNTGWQYCALPITLKEENITKITCTIDYSNNIGNINFTDMQFQLGDYEETKYENNLAIEKDSAHSNFKTFYEYEDSKLVKEILESKTTKKRYETCYTYNKNGRVVKVVDFNKIVKETVYNDKGVAIKSMTYHQDEPANIICEQTCLDDKGNKTQEVNEFGQKLSDINYVDGTGIVSSVVDENGNKTAYGYDKNDTLIQATTTVNGEENTNIFGYTLDFLTCLTHNNFNIKYSYDSQGRKTDINIADSNHIKKLYGNFEEITLIKLESSKYDIYKTTFNQNGDVLDTYYKSSVELSSLDNLTADSFNFTEEDMISRNVYNIYGNMFYHKEMTNKNIESEITYHYNRFGKLVDSKSHQHGLVSNCDNKYDDSHSNIVESVTLLGSKYTKYEYKYSSDPNNRLEQVVSPLGTQTIEYDKLGRIVKNDLQPASTFYSYLTIGGQTSNLVSSITLAQNKKSYERLNYKYDTKGNITEVRSNNILKNRYEYDSLSRLVREDNKDFGTTTTFDYDGGGNITCKKVYPFTLASNLNLEQDPIVVPYAYNIEGWKDQLLSYNGEKFEYDLVGNPTTYRNKKLEWTQTRQLSAYNITESNGEKTAQVRFKYNASGIRTAKISNGYTTRFYLNGNKIIRQTDGQAEGSEDAVNTLNFYYGANGITGFHITSKNASNEIVIDADYYYQKNVANDIVGLYSTKGDIIAKYEYDAWGNQTVKYLHQDGTFHTLESDFNFQDLSNENRFVANKNPFRYRSYYLDFETNLYYLNSRYYDSQTGRFLNSDIVSILDETQDYINGLNLYSYCNNNPVMNTDDSGDSWWEWLIVGLTVIIVAAVAVTATIMSGGSLGALLFGAGFGAITSGFSSAISGIATGTFSFKQLFLDMFFGAITGLIGGSALGAIGSALAMGAIGFVQSMATDLSTTGSVNYFKATVNGLIGAIFSDSGAQNGQTAHRQRLLQSRKQTINKINAGQYTLRGGKGALNSINRNLIKATNKLYQVAKNIIFSNFVYGNLVDVEFLKYYFNSIF